MRSEWVVEFVNNSVCGSEVVNEIMGENYILFCKLLFREGGTKS